MIRASVIFYLVVSTFFFAPGSEAATYRVDLSHKDFRRKYFDECGTLWEPELCPTVKTDRRPLISLFWDVAPNGELDLVAYLDRWGDVLLRHDDPRRVAGDRYLAVYSGPSHMMGDRIAGNFRFRNCGGEYSLGECWNYIFASRKYDIRMEPSYGGQVRTYYDDGYDLVVYLNIMKRQRIFPSLEEALAVDAIAMTTVPLPAPLAPLGASLATLALWRRARRKKAERAHRDPA